MENTNDAESTSRGGRDGAASADFLFQDLGLFCYSSGLKPVGQRPTGARVVGGKHQQWR